MDIIELLIITLLSIFQAVFGIGLLLIGTPTFLLIGYNFFDVLNLLLPFSITISFLQVIYSKEIDSEFNKKILLYCIPSLILALSILVKYENNIDLGLVTSFFLENADPNDEYALTAYTNQADGVDDMFDGNQSWYSIFGEQENSLSLTSINKKINSVILKDIKMLFNIFKRISLILL